jgi:heterotetrameric sarcosine oxidase gamma subunit
VTYAFLSADRAAPGVVARSPMERKARAAGARFDVRGGWNVAVGYPGEAPDRVSWADASHLGKLQVDGDHGVELGNARRDGRAWLCPLTRARAVVICPAGEAADWMARLGDGAAMWRRSVVDVTTAYAALRIQGPLARELFARFCALDLRPHVTPPGAFRPGSVARTPGMVLCEAPDTYLALVGAALGEYLWTVVEDAGRHLGGGPIPYA